MLGVKLQMRSPGQCRKKHQHLSWLEEEEASPMRSDSEVLWWV